MRVEDIGRRADALRGASPINLDGDVYDHVHMVVAEQYRPELRPLAISIVRERTAPVLAAADQCRQSLYRELEPLEAARLAVTARIRPHHYKSRSWIAAVAGILWLAVLVAAYFMRDPDGSYPFRGTPGLILAGLGFLILVVTFLSVRNNREKAVTGRAFLNSQDAVLERKLLNAETSCPKHIDTLAGFDHALRNCVADVINDPRMAEAVRRLVLAEAEAEIVRQREEHDRHERKAQAALLDATAPRRPNESRNVAEMRRSQARSSYEWEMSQAQRARRETESAERKYDALVRDLDRQ